MGSKLNAQFDFKIQSFSLTNSKFGQIILRWCHYTFFLNTPFEFVHNCQLRTVSQWLSIFKYYSYFKRVIIQHTVRWLQVSPKWLDFSIYYNFLITRFQSMHVHHTILWHISIEYMFWIFKSSIANSIFPYWHWPHLWKNQEIF